MAAITARRDGFSGTSFWQAVAARVASWRYVGAKRDLRFDLLRGLAVIAMVADHVGGQRSWLYVLTGGNHFWTSAAEGFVFISGLVMGVVYPTIIARDGIAAAMVKALKRAWTLYMLTVILTLATAALAFKLRLHWAPLVDAATLPDFVVGVLTLHRAYYLTDVLLMYTLLILGASLALYLISRGRTAAVLAFSWGLWGLWQLWPQQAALPWTIADNSVFNLSAWQLLFFNGLVLGYHRKALAQRFGWFTGRAALAVSGLLFAASIVLYRQNMALLTRLTGKEAAWLDLYLFSKADERIGRVIAFAIFASFALALVTNLWQPILRAFGWLLLPLGQNALWAYGLHLFVIMGTTLAGRRLFGTETLDIAQNTLLQVAGIMTIWFALTVRPRVAEFMRGLRPQVVVRPAARQQLVALPVQRSRDGRRG